MTATQSIDLPGWLAEQLFQASPDLLRAMLQTFAEALMSADADAVCGAGYGQRGPGPEEHPQRLPARRVGYPRRVDRSGDPEAAGGKLLPRVAARAAPTSRIRPRVGGRDQLSARRLDPADGEAGRDPRHHPVEEVPGQRDGQGPRRPGGSVPQPTVGRRARTPSSPPTHWCSKYGRAVGRSTCTPCSRPG